MTKKKRNIVKRKTASDDIVNFSEGNIQFKYYPYTGEVFCPSSHSLVLTAHHFGLRGFEISESRSEIHKNMLFVHPPTDMEKVEAFRLIKKTLRELKDDRKQKRAALIANNINNRTGNPITWATINAYIHKLKTGDLSRDKVARWFNTFNVEEDKHLKAKNTTVIEVSTRSKATIIKMGLDILKRLFKEGKLRRLTEEQYQAKMEVYAKEKADKQKEGEQKGEEETIVKTGEKTEERE